MNKFYAILLVLLTISCSTASAFSLKNIFSKENVENVVSAVVGESALTPQTLAGVWHYQNSAVKLESDKVLTEVAGSVATTQMENKLDGALAKVGISSGLMTFTFGSDMTFECATKGRTLRGTYEIDEDNKLTLNFSAVRTINIGRVAAHAELSVGTLSLLFNVDKLIKIVDAIASVSGNSTLQAFDSLLNNYDGVMIGFDFKR